MAQFKIRLGVGAKIILLVGILSRVSLPVTAQFTNGATTASCVILRDPVIDPQPADTSPYTIVTSPNRYTPGEVMDVILLASPRGTTFEGALLQAREVGSVTPIGIFGIPSFRLANFFDCGGSPNGTVTNNNNVTKTPPITFTWTPPGNQVGDIEINFVVEKTPGIYWIERLIVSSIPLPFCSSSPCSDAATCVEVTDGFTCICPPSFTGPTCEIQIIDYVDLNGGLFDIEDYSSVAGYTSFIFTNVPANSYLDFYGPGERVEDFKIGDGNEVGLNEFIPVEQVGDVRITGESFWIKATINDANLRFPELRIVMYQFSIPAPIPPATQSEIPAELTDYVGPFCAFQSLPVGANIVNVRGVEAANIRLGIGRSPGENEAKAGQTAIRTLLYDAFIWMCFTRPVPSLEVDMVICPTDPCEPDECKLGYCIPSPKGCEVFNCRKLTSSPCASCDEESCAGNGVCIYDPLKRRSYDCDCKRPWGGRRCDDWRFRDIAPGETFDMQLPSFPLFLPMYQNFYTLFTVTEENRSVRILEVEGFVARFGVGSNTKHNDVDPSLQEFSLEEGNTFWMVTTPDGSPLQYVRFLIV